MHIINSDSHGELEARRRIVAALRSRSCDERCIFEVELALTEALTNAIRHGNGCDPQKQVCVSYEFEDGALIIQVADQGVGFSPQQVADPTHPDNKLKPNGRGVFLIHKFMDDVQYSQRGSVVRMRKQLTSSRIA